MEDSRIPRQTTQWGYERKTAKKQKLDGRWQTISEGYGHYLGWSRRTGDRQSRMASTCGQMRAELRFKVTVIEKRKYGHSSKTVVVNSALDIRWRNLRSLTSQLARPMVSLVSGRPCNRTKVSDHMYITSKFFLFAYVSQHWRKSQLVNRRE